MSPATLMTGIASVAAVTTITTRTLAVDKTWADNGNVQWPNVSNWIPNGIPTTSDTAIFNMGVVTPPYNVVFLTAAFQPINAVIDRLRIDSSPINFTPPQSTLTIDSINITETARGLVIGRTPPGGVGTPTAVLDSLLGQLNTVYATFGVDAGSSGTLNVNAGTFNVTGTSAQFPLILGLNGAGQLNVSGGYTVDIATHAVLGKNAGSSGIANVSGSGTTWTNGGSLYVGYAGQGTFNIASAGQVQTDFPATLGDQAGAIGDVNVVGTSSTWNVGSLPGGTGYELTIGRFGSGFLDIWSGADVTLAGDSVLAHQPQSTGNATIDGTGSQWIQQGEIHIGYDGAASIGISGGALLQTTYGYVGGYPGSEVTAGSGQGSVNITGANSHWNTTTGWISLGSGTIGQGGYGSLTVTSGGRVTTTDLGIGNSFDSTGHASVSGPNSIIQVNGGDLYVGLQGAGTLNISAGGTVVNGDTFIGNNAGSTGDAILTGSGSEWSMGSGDLYVGNAGSGTLEIQNSGQVNNASAYVGNQGGSVGVVTVAADSIGLLSNWYSSGDMHVGNFGTGTLNISRGFVQSSAGYVGNHVGSIGEVGLSGSASSRWVVGSNSTMPDGLLVIGNEGEGSLNIHELGDVAAGIIIIGNEPTGIGAVTVDGNGSTLTTGGHVFIGAEGNGSLSIMNGGLVQAGGALGVEVGYVSGSTGEVTIDGPASRLEVNGSATAKIGMAGAGTVLLAGGGTIEAPGFEIGQLGEIRGAGIVVGMVMNGGLISPGASVGVLHVVGTCTQTVSGELLIEVAAATSSDQLTVAGLEGVIGTATLSGTLTVNLINGFTPSPGQTFTIITAEDVDGTFARVNLPKGIEVVYTPTSVVLNVTAPPCPADVNNSGFVDVDDLIAVILAWGACPMPPTPCPADTNNSGAVDVDDLIAVILAWGACP